MLDIIKTVRTTAESISEMVSSTYQHTKIDEYGASLTRIIQDNDMILGSGLWFEKNIYQKRRLQQILKWARPAGLS